MRHGFLDWLGRVAMLALAGMVTLSIIGSIAAIPSGSIQTRIGLEPRLPVPEAAPPLDAPRTPPEQARGPASVPGSVGGAGPALPGPAGESRWLETIAYALLGLTGLAALAVIALWRAVHAGRRIADALEELARRR